MNSTTTSIKRHFKYIMYPEFPQLTGQIIANLHTYHRVYKRAPLPQPLIDIDTYLNSIKKWKLYKPIIEVLADYCQVIVSWYRNPEGAPGIKFIGYKDSVELFKILWPYIYENLEKAFIKENERKSIENSYRRCKNKNDKGLDARTYSSQVLEMVLGLLYSNLIHLLEDYQNTIEVNGIKWVEPIESWVLINGKPKYNFKNLPGGDRKLCWARAPKGKMVFNRIINI